MHGNGLTDVSKILFDGMKVILDSWAKQGGESEALYWLLRIKVSQIETLDERTALSRVPDTLRPTVQELHDNAERYWNDVRYASLEPTTVLWGTIVNGLRVAADSDRATEGQRRVFAFPVETLVGFFTAARDRMDVADHLYHAFRAMPAPECQAVAALLNVHVNAQMDGSTIVRLVRLLDHEGQMTESERHDLTAISSTSLVSAAFSGLRGEG